MMSGDLQHQLGEPGGCPSVPITVPLVIVLATWAFAVLTYHPWTSGPRTFRGRFDHLQIGMTKAEVRAVMGRPGDDPPSWQDFPTYAILYEEVAGATKRQEFEAPPWKVYFGDPGSPAADRGLERWGSGNAAVCVQYDSRGRVIELLWLEERPREPKWLLRLRAWLPF
jgi:hypothetical protein